MSETYVATATTTIDAPPEAVWNGLTDPELIPEYFFEAEVDTDWEEGSPIVFSGEWEGETYEDKGEIVENAPGERLVYTHWSPLSGKPDVPENYHTVTYELSAAGEGTELTVVQDGNDSAEARDHSEGNWETMLASLRDLLES